MIGLDTNILLRYLVQDDEKQARLASDLIEGKLSAHEQGFISSVVLVELYWTLERRYKIVRNTLLDTIEKLLTTEELSFEHRDEAWKALQSAKSIKVGFTDALISIVHQKYGCEITLTFDKRASRMGTFSLLDE